MKLNAIQKTRLAIRRAFAKQNMARIEYKKKSDDTKSTYFIDMNFIEDDGSTFNTYSYATGFKSGGSISIESKRLNLCSCSVYVMVVVPPCGRGGAT
jgi:hypothetical protein